VARKHWILPIVLLAFGAALIVAVIRAPYTRDQWLRHQMKVTVTHMSQVGRLFALTKPVITDCHELLANATKQGIDLSGDTCLDGWGNPIRLEVKYDTDQSPHYVLTSPGPRGGPRGKSAFVWTDGHFEKRMPGTPP
jgi:hypothetical protein